MTTPSGTARHILPKERARESDYVISNRISINGVINVHQFRSVLRIPLTIAFYPLLSADFEEIKD